jgi:hypothetical protein
MPSNYESRRLWRSVGAIIAGALVGIFLSLATDAVLRVAGLLPGLGEPASNSVLLLAIVYRTVYGVLGSYVCARLAPLLPLRHSIILGFLGLAANVAGTVATWNKGAAYGPHWYPVTLIVLALPTAWAGAKLWIAQRRATSQTA